MISLVPPGTKASEYTLTGNDVECDGISRRPGWAGENVSGRVLETRRDGRHRVYPDGLPLPGPELYMAVLGLVMTCLLIGGVS